MSNGHMYVYRGEWKLILYSYCLIFPEIPEGYIWRKHFRNLMILNSISRHLRHQSYSDRTWKNVWRSSYKLILIVNCCHVYDRYKVLHDGRVMAIVRLADISSTSSMCCSAWCASCVMCYFCRRLGLRHTIYVYWCGTILKPRRSNYLFCSNSLKLFTFAKYGNAIKWDQQTSDGRLFIFQWA